MAFEDIFNEAIRRRGVWNLSSYSWSTFGYILIVTGTLSGLSITAFTDTLGVEWTRAMGFLSAACTALVASLHPIDTGDNFREAWRILDQAILEYRSTDKTREDVLKLLKSLHEGEKFLGQASIKIVIPNGNTADINSPTQPATGINPPEHH
jgi:hypothetical protein